MCKNIRAASLTQSLHLWGWAATQPMLVLTPSLLTQKWAPVEIMLSFFFYFKVITSLIKHRKTNCHRLYVNLLVSAGVSAGVSVCVLEMWHNSVNIKFQCALFCIIFQFNDAGIFMLRTKKPNCILDFSWVWYWSFLFLSSLISALMQPLCTWLPLGSAGNMF